MNDCALCRAPGSYLEHLNEDWTFCAACARCYRVDAEGKVTTSADTNHAPQRKRVEKDVSGNEITDP